MRVNNRRTLPFILAIIVVLAGMAFLQPNTMQQFSTLTVSLLLLAFIPWVIDGDYRRSVVGICLGALLGWPVAVSFSFWPIELVFVALGWTIGIAADRPRKSSPNDKPVFRFSLAFAFAVMFLFASILYVFQFQTGVLSTLESSFVRVDRNATLRPSARILIRFNSNGDYVFGNQTAEDYDLATTILKQNIEALLAAGVSPDEIFVTCISANRVHRNKVWLLRDAFENVRGRELSVAFLEPAVEIEIDANGNFVFGDKLVGDRAEAASILQQKVDNLLSVGVTADEIVITVNAVDKVNRNKALILREEIANALGTDLTVESGTDTASTQ